MATFRKSVGVVSTEILAVAPWNTRRRTGFVIVNDSAVKIFLSFSGPAEVDKGTALFPNGGSICLYGPSVPETAINAIAATAGAEITGEDW